MIDEIDLVVPHQANKTMVTELAVEAGLTADKLFFNIERVGNTSAASIPLAIHDAVRTGVINRPTRPFAPGFGAGAVGRYSVLRIDPAIIAPVDGGRGSRGQVVVRQRNAGSSSFSQKAMKPA